MISRRSVSTRTGASTSIVAVSVFVWIITACLTWLSPPVLIAVPVLCLCFLLILSATFSGVVKEMGEGADVDRPIVKYERH